MAFQRLDAWDSFEKCLIELDQLLIGFPPAIGHFLCGCLLKFLVGTRHQVMAFVLGRSSCRVRNIHPPAIAEMAFIKHQFVTIMGNGHHVFEIFRVIALRIVALPLGNSFQKAPYKLCCKMTGVPGEVHHRVDFKNPE